MIGSPAVGAGGRLEPCGDELRATWPLPGSAAGERVGVTLSGGGFRATLAGLGVIRLLADAGLLGSVQMVSSVSGGSIANGVLARAWPDLQRQGFSSRAVDELVVGPVVRRISRESLKRKLLTGLWRAIPPGVTRTDLLARSLDEWFFTGQRLEELDPGCRWVINAANLTTGARFVFEREIIGDYVTGYRPAGSAGVRLAQAVAVSASVPGVFAATRFDDADYPCSPGDPVLVDGGAYDNTGLEAMDSDRYRDVFTVTCNAGGLFTVGGFGGLPIIKDLQRANSSLYKQSTAVRTRWMVDRFEAAREAPDGESPEWAREGVLFGLATEVDPGGRLAEWADRYPERVSWKGKHLADVPTVFDQLEEGLCWALVQRGWWLTGACLARYHPERATVPADVTPPETSTTLDP